MRVISLVPSWTETLLEAKIDVVGRTRFCIHPTPEVESIPVVGGTKDWNWEKIQSLRPDLLLLDQEENPKFMSEQSTIPWYATHVQSIDDMPSTVQGLSQAMKAEELRSLSRRWQKVIEQDTKPNSFEDLPGLLEWGRKPEGPIEKILYMIWKDPWMAVSQDTFIGSVLKKLGMETPLFPSKYPTLVLEDHDPKTTLLLFSSEPYPFLKKKQALSALTFPHAFVDGECFSWFGVRALRFLENQKA